MDQTAKALEDIDLLSKGFRHLIDIFSISDNKNIQNFEKVAAELDAILSRLDRLERDLSDQAIDIINSTSQCLAAADPQLPLAPGCEGYKVPVLNFGSETLVDIYNKTPVLLQPFSRPCSISSRTLSGEIDTVELDLFAQGSTWVLESLDGWLLVPRPGSLDRKAPLTSLERLYVIEGVRQLPVKLHLQQPAQLDSVVIGRRWQLREKGRLSVSPNALRVGLSERLSAMEDRLAKLEGLMQAVSMGQSYRILPANKPTTT